MFYQCPPVGNPVLISGRRDTALPDFLSSKNTALYASGTAALAAALSAALQLAKTLKGITDAEIILPAYGCPDLVSAVIQTGARVVLVDLQKDRPWLDLALLEQAITDKTAAVVAVNLFGIAERWQQLQNLCRQHEVNLIEDSAQYFPGEAESQQWHGDMVVLSFGRGKPVSLLGGGAVLINGTDEYSQALYEALPRHDKVEFSTVKSTLLYVKAVVYNLLLSPFVYWLPQSLPFLHLGETRYHELRSIDGIDTVRAQWLSANVKRYQQDAGAQSRCEKISAMLDALEHVINLPRRCTMPLERRLLRYPILVEAGQRNQLYQQLQQAGVGVSKMYPAAMPEIEGLQNLLEQRQYPQAADFAECILTLPTHAGVSDAQIDKMQMILKTVLS